MTYATMVSAALLFAHTMLGGPPRVRVQPVTSPNGGAVTSLTVSVDYHTSLEEFTLSARAEGVVGGQRVSKPLTVSRVRDSVYTVARNWTVGTPWVVIVSAEQGAHGDHGVAEAIVSLNAQGAMTRVEYTVPGFIGGTRAPDRVTPARVNAALQTLGVSVP